MKKLVALIAVLAVASMANAAMIYELSANNVTAGTVVTVNVVVDATTAKTFVLNVSSNIAPAKFGIGTVSATMFPLVRANGTVGNGVGGLAIYNIAGSSLSIVAPGTWYSFTIDTTGLAAGAYTLTSMNSNNGTGGVKTTAVGGVATTVPTVTLNVVPEPMTLALLGLGGLFLRRKSA